MSNGVLPLLVADALDADPLQENRAKSVRSIVFSLAEKLGTQTDLVHIESIEKMKVPKLKLLFSSYFSKQEERLRSHARSNGSPVRSLFLFGDPVTELLRLSTKNRYELIALATHGRKGLSRMVLGSVTEEIVRNSKIPVLAFGPALKPPRNKAFENGKIRLVVGTDLAENSRRAELYALDLASRLNAEVILIHCLFEGFHPVLQTAFSKPHRPAALVPVYNDAVEKALAALERRRALFKRRGVLATPKLDEKTRSASSTVLAEISRRRADLVVMGTRGRALITGALLGRTVRRVILESPIPVVTLK